MSAPLDPRRAARVALRLAGWALAGMAIASFLGYVWPTRWRYDHMTDEGETYIVRIDRISGEAEVLLPNEGWVPVADEVHGPPEEGSQGI